MIKKVGILLACVWIELGSAPDLKHLSVEHSEDFDNCFGDWELGVCPRNSPASLLFRPY